MTDETALLLSAEERAEIDRIKRELDPSDSVTVVEYGIGCQRRLAEFADRILENSGRGTDDTTEHLNALLGEIRSLDAGSVLRDTFWARIPIIGCRARRMRRLKKQFSRARVRIESLEQRLECSRMELLRGAEYFDIMAQDNAKCFREITLYIRAGKERLEALRTDAVPKLAAEVQKSGDPMAAQLLHSFEENLSRFDSRLHDLELSRTIALQSAPQIKLIQSVNVVMAQKIQSAVLNTIPIWKNQFAAAVGLNDQAEFYKTQRRLDRMTNKMVQRRAELLRQSAVQTAAESRRSGIDSEALSKANSELIRAIEETMRLSQESRSRNRQAEAELEMIDRKLKSALSQAGQR